MKFSQALLGARAERAVECEIRGVTCAFALRPLTGAEEGVVLERATAYATEKHAAKCEPGNSLFDLGIMLHSLALACVDTESPADKREPYFDGGAAQIADALDTEQIAFLYARFELWQDECSPTVRAQTGEELVRHLVEIVGSDSDLPFARLRLGTLATLVRILGSLALSSAEGRSQLGSLFANTTTR